MTSAEPGYAHLYSTPDALAVHVPLHPERYLFRFIRDGIPSTDDEIWHVTNYIQTLAE